MKNLSLKKVCLTLLVVLCLLSFAELVKEPDTLNIIVGQETNVRIKSIFKNISLSQNEEIISVNGTLDSNYKVDAKKSLKFLSKKEGIFDLTVNIFNGVPIKHIKVNVLPNEKVYVGGELIGVKLDTAGVIAVGFGKINAYDGTAVSPANEAGIKEGDIVKRINGKEVNKASEVREILNNISNESITISVERSGEIFDFAITPVKDKTDDQYKIGLWVRDNVAGVGTLTFVTEDQKQFAALGHAITDATTHITVPVKSGELLAADIVNVVKSEKNLPGEIRGIFSNTEQIFGTVDHNDDFGIYGYYKDGLVLDDKMLLPIATQDEIVQGPALMVCTIGDRKETYDINIKEINYQTSKNSKSMLIEVTDENLLEKTGGIVQGMSGSPIIQNGKVIGAVTHVLVNNPKQGYAIFIEWMVNNFN